MKKIVLSAVLILLSSAAFCQQLNEKQNLSKQINELLISVVDTNLIFNIDKIGTAHVMYKNQDDLIDFSILDIDRMDVYEPGDGVADLSLYFHCRGCLNLTSLSAEKRKKFDRTTLIIPIRYKAVGEKIIDKIKQLKKLNR